MDEHDESTSVPHRHGLMLAGRYRLDDLMSETGAGQFWHGYDTILERSVAIHAIPADDPRADSVLRAARDSAQVTESRFLRVLDLDTRDGMTFVVNEWGTGTSLDQVLAVNGPLAPRRAAWIAGEVASALAVAHEAGIAHGRLAPENVLLDTAGSVRIIGFSVEAALHGLDGDRIGIDVVDLAGILHALLTGFWPGLSESSLPRAARESGSILERDRSRFLTPRQVHAGVPTALDELCNEVLNRPHGRHAGINSAEEIRDTLTAFVGDPSDLEAVAVELAGVGGRRTSPRPDPERTGPLALSDVPTELGTPIFDDTGEVEWFSPRSGAAPTPPPAPPAQTAPEERPLFAPDATRTPRPTTPRPVSSAGLAADSEWLFSAPSGIEEDTPPGRWLRISLTIGVVVLLVLAGLLAYALTRSEPSGEPTDPGSSSAAPAAPQVISGVTAQDFDPLSDPPTEYPELAALAVDGDPKTAWRTQNYYQQLGPKGLKTGIGLILDLQDEHSVASLTLKMKNPGAKVSVYVTDTKPSKAPTEIDGLEPAAALSTTVNQTIALDTPVTGRYVTLWFTALPPVDGAFRLDLNEATVRGNTAN